MIGFRIIHLKHLKLLNDSDSFIKRLIKIIINFRKPFSIKRNEEEIKIFTFKVKESLGLRFIKLLFLLVSFIFFESDMMVLQKINPIVSILSIKINVINLINNLILKIF